MINKPPGDIQQLTSITVQIGPIHKRVLQHVLASICFWSEISTTKVPNQGITGSIIPLNCNLCRQLDIAVKWLGLRTRVYDWIIIMVIMNYLRCVLCEYLNTCIGFKTAFSIPKVPKHIGWLSRQLRHPCSNYPNLKIKLSCVLSSIWFCSEISTEKVPNQRPIGSNIP